MSLVLDAQHKLEQNSTVHCGDLWPRRMKYQHTSDVHSCAQNNFFGEVVWLLFSCRDTKANCAHCWAIGIKNARFLCLQVSLLYPQPGYVEIDPDALWSKVVAVVKEAISGKTLFWLFCNYCN